MAHGSLQQPVSKKSLDSRQPSAAEPRIALGLSIDAIEKKYGGHYVGQYDLPNRRGPFLLFYTDNPDRSKGHDNYYAIGRQIGLNGLGDIGYTDSITIYNGKTIRDAVFMAIEQPEGGFIVSRWHHDYVTGPRGEMMDGGCDYARYNTAFPPTHRMQIVDGHEVYTPLPPEAPKDAPKIESPILDLTVDMSQILHKRFVAEARNGMSLLMHDVGTFHRVMEQPIRFTPQFLNQGEQEFRDGFLKEEMREYEEGIAENDLIKIADAFSDMIYVIVGTALFMGIPLDHVWEVVQDSNMAKVDPETGKVSKFPNGKVRKPPGWQDPKPQIAKALGISPEL